MKLKIFNKENTSYHRTGYSLPNICIEGKYGHIVLSGEACNIIGLKKADCLEFLHDEEQPKDWFMSPGSNGIKLREPKPGSPQLCITSTVIARKIIASVKKTDNKEIKTAWLKIIEKPVDYEGRKLWLIITSDPINLSFFDKNQ